MRETWKWIKRFKGYYQASTYGRIRSVGRTITTPSGICRRIKGRILNPKPNKDGYKSVFLCKHGEYECRLIHHLILETFVGHKPVGKECRHIDGNPSNNRVTNLIWGTDSENYQDRVRHGTSNSGDRSGSAILNWKLVRRIRKVWNKQAKLTMQEIGSLFGASTHQVWSVVNHKSWRE